MRSVENPQKVVGVVTKNPEAANVFSTSLKSRNFTPVVYETKKDLHRAIADGSTPDGLIVSARNALGLSREALRIPRIEAVKGETERNERRVITAILNRGAWSYIATGNEKPKDVADLAAAKMNRFFSLEGKRVTNQSVEIDNISVDLVRMHLKIDGENKPCPPTALEILGLLMGTPDIVFSRKAIVDHLHKEGMQDSALKQHVVFLRQALGDSEEGHVETVRGIGIKFTTNPKK